MTYTTYVPDLNKYAPFSSESIIFAHPMNGGVKFVASARGVVLSELLMFPFTHEDLLAVKHRMEENLRLVITF